MILPYPVRLVCLSLATFLLIDLALSLAAWLLAPAAIRLSRRVRPAAGTRLLLGLRLAPPALSVLLVAVLCVPSFLRFESEAGAEKVGPFCIAAALLALTTWACSTVRGVRAAIRSRRYVERCLRSGHRKYLPGEAAPVWVVEDTPGCLLLAGIVRPRVLISPAVLNALSVRQLAAALRHERVHQLSRDNLKRLFLLLAPDILPFARPFAAVDRAWSRLAEWAADDGAVAGNRKRSISLATALVRVARLVPAKPAAPLVNCFLEQDSELSVRVDRLLRTAQPREEARVSALFTAGACAALVSLGIAMLQPGTLYTAHQLFERLVN